MNNRVMFDAVVEISGLGISEVINALEAFVSTVSEELAKGEKIALIGFGTFSVSEKSARTGINPATKQTITIPAKKVVKFKAGAELDEKVK